MKTPKSTNPSTKKLLDKYHLVENHIDNPKFIPYNNTEGEEVSPLTDFMYYSKLPEVYRTFDKPLGYPLYRYLQSLFNSGYAVLANKLATEGYDSLSDSEKVSIGGIENLLDLVNPETCPNKFLPYYCRSLGIDWFPDLAKLGLKDASDNSDNTNDYYNRTFLCNIGEIYRRRGTESCVKYIAQQLTSMDVKLKYERVFNEDLTTKARILWVEVQANTIEEITKLSVATPVIKRYIDTQIPYYITTAVLYVLRNSTSANRYNGNFVRSTIRKTIKCRDENIKTTVEIKAGRQFGNVQSKLIEQEIKPQI